MPEFTLDPISALADSALENAACIGMQWPGGAPVSVEDYARVGRAAQCLAAHEATHSTAHRGETLWETFDTAWEDFCVGVAALLADGCQPHSAVTQVLSRAQERGV
jgi:hypothetical protein